METRAAPESRAWILSRCQKAVWDLAELAFGDEVEIEKDKWKITVT
jgi:hypothetical protein